MIKTVLPEKVFSIKIVPMSSGWDLYIQMFKAIALAMADNIMIIFLPILSVIYIFVVEI